MQDLGLQKGNALDLFNSFLRDLGIRLEGSEGIVTEAYEHTNTLDPQISLVLRLPIKANIREFNSSKDVCISVFRNLYDNARTSNIVKQELRIPELALETANSRIRELEAKLLELEQYKTHYELEMKLRHGRK